MTQGMKKKMRCMHDCNPQFAKRKEGKKGFAKSE